MQVKIRVTKESISCLFLTLGFASFYVAFLLYSPYVTNSMLVFGGFSSIGYSYYLLTRSQMPVKIITFYVKPLFHLRKKEAVADQVRDTIVHVHKIDDFA